MRTCLSCDALQSPEARFCQSCGTLLPEESFAGEHSTQALAQPPSSQALPEIRAYAQSFRQPHAEASLTLGALAALCVVVGIGAVAISGSTEYLYALGVIRHNLPDYSAALRGRRYGSIGVGGRSFCRAIACSWRGCIRQKNGNGCTSISMNACAATLSPTDVCPSCSA